VHDIGSKPPEEPHESPQGHQVVQRADRRAQFSNNDRLHAPGAGGGEKISLLPSGDPRDEGAEKARPVQAGREQDRVLCRSTDIHPGDHPGDPDRPIR
jgi:hypothetical protein